MEEVAAWKASGRSSRDYARSRGISPATLLWWSSRGGAHSSASVGTKAAAPHGRSVFVPLRVAPPSAGIDTVELELVLAGGRRLRVVGGVALAQLARVIDAVEGGARC